MGFNSGFKGLSGLFHCHFASKTLYKFLGFDILHVTVDQISISYVLSTHYITIPHITLFDLIFLIKFGEVWPKK